ncbi:MAG TPA: hypothetical protein VIC08_11645 [Cellvibrionaceae bacterium]
MRLFDREYRVPSAFKEVLGERQSLGALLSIALVAAVAAGFWATSPEFNTLQSHLSLWRVLVASALMLDIAAGTVANFTPGTNAFYAQRPAWRWGFIAIHIHLPLVGLLVGAPLLPLIGIWAFTIAAASVVNLCYQRRWQPVLAGALLSIGILITAQMPLPTWLMSLALLFMIKVLYAFAVNHYPQLEAGAT